MYIDGKFKLTISHAFNQLEFSYIHSFQTFKMFILSLHISDLLKQKKSSIHHNWLNVTHHNYGVNKIPQTRKTWAKSMKLLIVFPINIGIVILKTNEFICRNSRTILRSNFASSEPFKTRMKISNLFNS